MRLVDRDTAQDQRTAAARLTAALGPEIAGICSYAYAILGTMESRVAALFRNGANQAVRIPNDWVPKTATNRVRLDYDGASITLTFVPEEQTDLAQLLAEWASEEPITDEEWREHEEAMSVFDEPPREVDL